MCDLPFVCSVSSSLVGLFWASWVPVGFMLCVFLRRFFWSDFGVERWLGCLVFRVLGLIGGSGVFWGKVGFGSKRRCELFVIALLC